MRASFCFNGFIFHACVFFGFYCLYLMLFLSFLCPALWGLFLLKSCNYVIIITRRPDKRTRERIATYVWLPLYTGNKGVVVKPGNEIRNGKKK